MRIAFSLIKWALMFLGAAVLFVILLSTTEQVWAHEWYSTYCCDDKDCGPALGASYGEDGSLMLEVAPGKSVRVPAGFPVLPSRDGDFHVCIMINQVRCVYVPANS